MTEEEIRELYNEVINQRGIHNKLGLSRSYIYHLRNDVPPTLGLMLEQLLKLGKIKVELNDDNPKNT
jgi:hypothetical protein